MGFAISDGHEGREKTIMVETDMEFDGAFCCAELRPREDAQAEVNGGSVKGIQLVFKPEAVGVVNQFVTTQLSHFLQFHHR